MLLATPYDLISTLCRDADFRLAVDTPKSYHHRIRDHTAPGTDYNRNSCLRRYLLPTPCFRSRGPGKRQPRAEGGAGRDEERSLPRLLRFDTGLGKCLDGGLKVGELDRDLERPFSVPFERSPDGSVTAGREKVDGEAADIEGDTFRCEARTLIPAPRLRVEQGGVQPHRFLEIVHSDGDPRYCPRTVAMRAHSLHGETLLVRVVPLDKERPPPAPGYVHRH